MNKEQINKIKDWLVITRIRILNFIKEHKYVSAVIGLFLVSAIVGIVVRAANDTTVDSAVVFTGTGENALSVEVITDDKNLKAPNFSTITYKVNYYLDQGNSCNTNDGNVYKADMVEIKASVDEAAIVNEKGETITPNVRWGKTDETTSYEISEDGKTITIKAPQVNMCSKQVQNISLHVLNANNNTSIKPTITIKGGSKSATQNIDEVTTINSVSTYFTEELDLEPMVKPGIAEKVSDTQRDAIFGILLGIKSQNEISSLKGKHLKNSADIILLASQNPTGEYLDIYTNNTGEKKYFDVYKDSLHYFTEGNVPALTSSSGKINSLAPVDYFEGIAKETNSAPVVTMIGNKTETFEQYPIETIYRDETKIQDENGRALTYTETIYKDGATEPVSSIKLNEIGVYKINYKVMGEEDSSTTMTRTVEVVEPSSDKYYLKGSKTVYVLNANSYVEQGVYDRLTNSPITNYTTDRIDETENGYTIKYTIVNTSDDENTTIELKRKVKIVSSLPSQTSSKVTAEDSIISKGNAYVTQGIKMDDVEINCNGDKKCDYEPKTIDSSSVGEKYITYKITDDNKNIIEITKRILVVPQHYKLSISNIITSFDNLKKIDNEFYAIGSYYVTVKSDRSTNAPTSLKVNLKAILGNKTSNAEMENKQYSSGFDTSLFSNTMYVRENSEYVPVTNSAKNGLRGDYFTAAMGEEVKMSTKFEYGYDADENISELLVTIPVDGNLIPIAYSTELSTNPYFNLEAIYHGNKINGVALTNIKYFDSVDNEIIFEEFDESKQVIDHIKIVIKPSEDKKFEIRPGTTIKIDTKFKVRTYSSATDTSKDLSTLKFRGVATFSWESNGETLENTSDTGHDIYVTPYKTRTNVGVGQNDNYNQSNDIVLDASKNDTYTIYASPDVTSPAMNIQSNVFGYNRINSLPITIVLPKGINYVYNKEYNLEPQITYDDNNTYLTYNYSDVEPNSWIEPIYTDFNVDVSISQSSPIIKVFTGDPNNLDNSINNDVSSIDMFKTKQIKITIQNTENVSYGQYIYSGDKYISNIDIDGTFDFATKLHNNETPVSNIDIYTILPYNNTEKDSSYSGKLLFSDLPEGLLCTTDDASLIASDKTINNVNWQPCSNFLGEDGKYSGFTGYKLHTTSLNTNENLDTKIKVYTTGNKPEDSYKFMSYLSYTVPSTSTNSGYKNFRDIKVDVVSKKITGTVWEDFNVDGVMDPDEKKIENVTLKLYDETDNLIQTTTPNEKGVYTFQAVAEGKYYVVAEFNTDKYGLTGEPSEDFYDKSRLSVFKSSVIENSNDQIENDEIVEENTPEVSEEDDSQMSVIKTNIITIDNETRVVRNINLGLSLRKKFEVKLNKYITRTEVTNALGIVTTKDYEKTKLAKLDVKNINNLKIKVTYTLELQNVKYYPGYVGIVTEEIPEGMSFNENYEENKGWVMTEDGSLTNTTLGNEIIQENEKKYLTIAFDVTRKEAGSFVNFASVDGLNILGGREND